MKRKKSIGRVLLEKLELIFNNEADSDWKLKEFFQFEKYLFDEITKEENIHLSSLFSKIAFVTNKYKVPYSVVFQLQTFRRSMECHPPHIEDVDEAVNRFYLSLALAISYLFKISIADEKRDKFYRLYKTGPGKDNKQFIKNMEVLALECEPDTCILYCLPKETPFDEIKVKFCEAGKNDLFTENIVKLKTLRAFPINLELHHIEIDDSGFYIPRIIVIEPSFLIDITSIASCFNFSGTETRKQVLKRFLPKPSTKYLLIGHIANYLLDFTIINPTSNFDAVLKELFQLNPILFSMYNDAQLREIIQIIKLHFNNLKRTVQNEFRKNGLNRSNVYLEPSFLAPKFGIQGRLDLFHLNKKENKGIIVELKSGKAFRPNSYGLSNSHYVQTLLYDLLVKSVLANNIRLNNFILYSGEKLNHLRYAPALLVQQKEAIQVRNRLYIQQLELERIGPGMEGDSTMLDELRKKNFDKISGFEETDLKYFETMYRALNFVPKKYFDAFVGFIARELKMSKLGSSKSDKVSGLAGIWLRDLNDKKDSFSIINHVIIERNNSEHENPCIVFKKSILTAELSNFRVGDIAILYPDLNRTASVLHSQIFKCTVVSLEDDKVVLRLRSRQHNFEIFKTYDYWHIEHDVMDGSYNAMYRNIFEFGTRTEDVQNLWLSHIPPCKLKTEPVDLPSSLTPEQQEIFKEIVNAQDYYLLWGPPGTGKTSFMIHHVIKHLIDNSDENILLLAYTNRAVDELCESITQINTLSKGSFFRVGSRYSTAEKYRGQLLVNKLGKFTKRSQVLQLFQRTRIVVSTVSSISNKQELFDLIKFDRVIVDEASQLLEPMIIGLLSRFNKVILIGDHNQLPAVVQQDESLTRVEDNDLKSIGLINLADSLFERLYKRCEQNNWYWAIGQLHQQGRMHEEIMDFPNREFYGNQLKVIPKIPRLSAVINWKSTEGLQSFIALHRVCFFDTETDHKSIGFKTNQNEAVIVGLLVSVLKELYDQNKLQITKQSIGVITPYRAQIALIQSVLKENFPGLNQITVDTVERYQGSARDIIIMSFCMNHASQLDRLSSVSSEGVDRKLNVALTRARERVILVGNKELLMLNPLYGRLIQSAHEFILSKSQYASGQSN